MVENCRFMNFFSCSFRTKRAGTSQILSYVHELYWNEYNKKNLNSLITLIFYYFRWSKWLRIQFNRIWKSRDIITISYHNLDSDTRHARFFHQSKECVHKTSKMVKKRLFEWKGGFSWKGTFLFGHFKTLQWGIKKLCLKFSPFCFLSMKDKNAT